MKLYLYDRKHETVHAELDLGTLTESELATLSRVLYWLGTVGVTDGRYQKLVLAEGWHYECEEGCESVIKFD